MLIRFERTGGFANIPLRGEFDSMQMPPDRAQELKRLVAGARPFDQPAPPHEPLAIPDQFLYEMTIEDAGRTQSISISDAAAPDDLKLLFDFLSEEAIRKLKNR